MNQKNRLINLTCSSSILLYGFSVEEVNTLTISIKRMNTNDSKKGVKVPINFYAADHFTEIIAIPYAIGFIDFKDMKSTERDLVIEYFRECTAPLTSEMKEAGYTEEDFSVPMIYARNIEIDSANLPKNMRLFSEILDNPKRLRLTLLSDFKDNEGLGNSSTNSIRLYRVLQMYKLLKDKGELKKDDIDTLIYPDIISKSMFYRDIAVIKEIEFGNLKFDRVINGYRLMR